jgi:hypothetical protein
MLKLSKTTFFFFLQEQILMKEKEEYVETLKKIKSNFWNGFCKIN